MQKKKSINKMFLTIIGILLAIIFVAPILILVNSSFKTLQEIYIDILALPKHFSFQNYLKAFEKMDFLHSLINSLVITCVATVLILLVSSMAAWVMVRYKTKVSKVLFLVFSAALLIPFQCVMLPLVDVMSKLHLMNRPGLIFMYIGFGCSMSIVLFHGFIKNIPVDLETKYTTSKDDLSKLNAVDYSSEIGGGLAIERVAVVQQGNWIGPELSGIDEEVANKMGILPIPLKGVKEDCIPTGISIYWCINSQSGDKEKEASKEFLKWLFQSDEGKQIVVNDFGFVPAFNNYDDVEITDPLSKEVKRYIDEGKTLPWVMGGFPSGYEPKAAADFQGYFSGEYTFDQMVDQLKADFVELKK